MLISSSIGWVEFKTCSFLFANKIGTRERACVHHPIISLLFVKLNPLNELETNILWGEEEGLWTNSNSHWLPPFVQCRGCDIINCNELICYASFGIIGKKYICLWSSVSALQDSSVTKHFLLCHRGFEIGRQCWVMDDSLAKGRKPKLSVGQPGQMGCVLSLVHQNKMALNANLAPLLHIHNLRRLDWD